MKLEENIFYHCFNQGNNQEKIFFKKKNYSYFLNKVKKYWLPHIDIVAYCLMPNHFHFLVTPKKEYSEEKFKKDLATSLRSYTRAINVQENRSGSLFRQGTKFKSDLKNEFITVNHSDFTNNNSYARNCFEYIHQNPVKAKMVIKPEDWEFSSTKDYLGLRNETLCNLIVGQEL